MPPKNQSRTTHRAFRQDINGLRAWAVLSVVFFHFGILGFSGGFVGVDIFFVISGYLMTQIISSGLETGTFSLIRFYWSRATRILPALVAVCLALMVLGWFWLPTVDYRMVGTHAATAVLFVSNFKFWTENGYFGVASVDKWLLHTWSLSLEWQYYLLLPIVMKLFWKCLGSRFTLVALCLLALSSFCFSIYASYYWSSMAFYLLPARVWELLAGGLAYFMWRKGVISAAFALRCELLGLAMLLFSFFVFDETFYWPSAYACVPVLGSVLIILAARQDSIFTSNRIAQWLGSNSYSIYLWHWPVIVLLSYANLQHETEWLLVGLGATLIFGECSYRWVEGPSRAWLQSLTLSRSLIVCCAAVGIIASLGAWVRLQHNTHRIDPIIDQAMNEATNTNPRMNECHNDQKSNSFDKSCVYGSGELKAIVIGDSHADALITSVAEALKGLGSVMELTYSGCPTLLGAHEINPEYQCDAFNQMQIKMLSEQYQGIPLIVINRSSLYAYGHNESWDPEIGVPRVYFSKPYSHTTDTLLSEFKHSFMDTMCTLSAHRPVYVLRPIPEMDVNVPRFLSRRMLFAGDAEDVSISLKDYQARHDFIWKLQDKAVSRCGIHILDPLPYLCSEERCWGSRHGQPLYFDDDHLSESGNKILVPLFKSIF